MTKITSSSIARFTLAYALLGCFMVAAKFAEQPSVDGDGFSLLANLLGLLLLLPWILIFPGGRLGEGINTPHWFFVLSALNLVISLTVYLVMRLVEARRLSKPN